MKNTVCLPKCRGFLSSRIYYIDHILTGWNDDYNQTVENNGNDNRQLNGNSRRSGRLSGLCSQIRVLSKIVTITSNVTHKYHYLHNKWQRDRIRFKEMAMVPFMLFWLLFSFRLFHFTHSHFVSSLSMAVKQRRITNCVHSQKAAEWVRWQKLFARDNNTHTKSGNIHWIWYIVTGLHMFRSHYLRILSLPVWYSTLRTHT